MGKQYIMFEKSVFEYLISKIKNTAEPPRAKNITLSKTGWVQNETTEKYEYAYTDNTITENDYIMVDVLDEEQEEMLVAPRADTYNGGIKFRNDELPEADIELQLVITRVKPEPTTPTTPTEGEAEQEVTNESNV